MEVRGGSVKLQGKTPDILEWRQRTKWLGRRARDSNRLDKRLRPAGGIDRVAGRRPEARITENG